jgi:hypothetical protein
MRTSLKDRVLATSAALAASGLVAAALAASGGAAVAHAAKTCSVGSGREFRGYAYVTSLTASGTSCSTASSLVRAHGHKAGWRCSVKRLATSPIQYQARETCTSGRRRVVWGFTQNT